jgi:replicative DNA helicase
MSNNNLQNLEDYGSNFQSKVIALLISDNNFLNDVFDTIVVEDFNSASHQFLIEAILRYYSEFHIYPTLDALAIEVKKVSNEVLKIQIKKEVDTIMVHMKSMIDADHVKKNFFLFCRNQQMKSAIMTSADLVSSGGNFDDIFNIISKAVKAGVPKDSGLKYNTDVEARYRAELRKTIPFPWAPFNLLTQGGYGEGDLVLVFGSPGGGKSWVVCAMGAYAAKLGFNVVHYTLELGDIYTSKRYDAILTGIDSKDLGNHRDDVQEIMKGLEGTVVIKEYSPKRASLATIQSHLRQLESNEGFKPDLIIIDYLDYLRPSSVRKDRKEEIDDVFIEAKSLAKELKIPIISPSQANRTGAKSDILEGDNAAGSYDKIMIADIIISLARNKDDKVAGTGRFHFIKNRYGGDGLTFNALVNTNNGDIRIDNDARDEAREAENINNFVDQVTAKAAGGASTFFGVKI